MAVTKEAAEILALTAVSRKNNAEAENFELSTKLSALTLRQQERQEADELATEPRAHVYSFFTEITKTSTFKCMEMLSFWARREPKCEMKIIFNSTGGSITDGLALYDFLGILKDDGHKIEIMTVGMAASMAGVLLQAGTTRTMGKNAYILIHELSGQSAGKMSEIEDSEAFMKRLQARLLDILASRAKISKEKISENWKRRDWWLDSKEALKLGFVDRVR
jgi:ATP-dependent Clp endopeptidase proteolytic subunit ClpP